MAGLLFFFLLFAAGVQPAPGLVCPSQEELEVIRLINVERANTGLLPLTAEIRLGTAARKHSQDMAVQNFFSHDSLNGATFIDRIEAEGYVYWNWASENIAAGYGSPSEVVAGWMDSPGHRANILDPHVTAVGAGFFFEASDAPLPGYSYPFYRYWTTDFGASYDAPLTPESACGTLARGDFNSDGKTDILWRNKTTGQNIIWFMNSIVFLNSEAFNAVPDTNWQIAGTGDFNGDGKTDIVWRNYSTGQNTVWFMNGSAMTSWAPINSVVNVNWQIAGTGDFNGDGRTDIVWRNYSTGQNTVWFMNGSTMTSWAPVNSVVNVNWQIAGTGDFNGDGRTDIVWRNYSTGQNTVWFMNGSTMTSWAPVNTLADTNWEIVGPK